MVVKYIALLVSCYLIFTLIIFIVQFTLSYRVLKEKRKLTVKNMRRISKLTLKLSLTWIFTLDEIVSYFNKNKSILEKFEAEKG